MADQGPAGETEAGGLSSVCVAARLIFSTIPNVEHVKLTCDSPRYHAGAHHDPVHGHWEDEL